VTTSPSSVVRPAGGLAADLSTTAAKKQAMDVYEARKAGPQQPSLVSQGAQAMPAQAGVAAAAQRDRSAAPSVSYPSTTAIPGARIGSNDGYYQQQLEDQRRRARIAEDDRDYAEAQARRAQVRAVEAEIAAAQARRRVVAAGAVGGAAGYAGASALEDSTVAEPIAPTPILQPPPIPVPAERPLATAADAGESWGEKLVTALILVPAFGFLFWAIYTRYFATGSTTNTRRYTL
jgi:hypothetical protein